MNRKLLLISNSTNAGEEYLAWPRPFIKDFLEQHSIGKLLFIPYAGVSLSPESTQASYNVYEERVRNVFEAMGFSVSSIHHEHDPVAAVNAADSIMVGGGNTFHLVKMMHETGIMQPICNRVLAGIPFVGWSAGANVACPTMKTTNDMPISEPPSFSCLGLVPFQINPHYLDANPAGHGGETREQRLTEFMMINRDVYVAGLREATLLRVEGGKMELMGSRPMRLFHFGETAREINPGEDVSFLVAK